MISGFSSISFGVAVSFVTGLPVLFIFFSVLLAIMFHDLNVPYASDDPEAPNTLNFLAEGRSF